MCDVESRKKRTDSHIGAAPLLGMTGSVGDASFFTRHKIPHRADTQVGLYLMKWVQRTGRGEPAPAKRHGKFPISNS